MYRGSSNTRLDSLHPNHGHGPPSHTSQGNGGRLNSSSRYPNANLNSQPTSKFQSSSSRNNNDNAAADENIMHMKKSAEIAAIFSGAKINQTTDILDPILQNNSRTKENYNGDKNRLRQSYHGGSQTRREENNDYNKSRLSNSKLASNNQNRKLHSIASPQEMFSEADMHSSLGYFP